MMIPLDIPPWIVLSWLFVFGTVVGSFLNVCIYRIPHHERLWDQLRGLNHPPSSCPFCRRRILAIDNIPVLGWIWLRGRCRFCRHSIPIRYALIEFFNGVLWVVLYVAIVPSGYQARIESSCLFSQLGAQGQPNLSPQMLTWLVNAEYVYFLILAEALLVATFIDFDLMIIPDGVTVPGMIFGLLGSFVLGAPTLWPAWFFFPNELNGLQAVLPNYLLWLLYFPDHFEWLVVHPHWHGLVSSLLGLIVGGGTVWIVRTVGRWAFGREAMGFGDVVLMAMIGSYLGWQPSLIVFFLVAPLCALASTLVTMSFRLGREIPFGPYLSLAALLVVLCWRPYFSQLETFFGRGPILAIIFVLMAILLFPLIILVRFVKRLLGYRDEERLPTAEWNSGDQLAFYANKDLRDRYSTADGQTWPGVSSGRGTAHSDRWRGAGGQGR